MPSAHSALHTAPGDARAPVAVGTDAHCGPQKVWSLARGHTAGGAEARVSAQLFQGQDPAAAAVVQPLSRVRLFVTPLDCSTPGFSILHNLPECAQLCPLMLSSHLLLCHPLLLPSIFPSISALVAWLYPTLCNPLDSSPPGSSVHGILQARILEWVAIPFSRGSS